MFKLLDLGEVYEATIVRRLTRFEVLLLLNGKYVIAHNTNTGRLYDILVNGYKALLTPIRGKKLNYRLVGIEVYEGLYAVVDTLTQDLSFKNALDLNLIPYLHNCRVVKKNPRIGDVIHDYLLNCRDENVIVELKSAEFRGPRGEAMYPDCPTLRGRKHIESLIRIHRDLNMGTYLIFVAALPRPRCFMPFKEADPMIDELVRDALRKGVKVKGIAIFMDGKGSIYLENPDLPPCSEWLCTTLTPQQISTSY